jgi:small-conductance mechanosensitive channel
MQGFLEGWLFNPTVGRIIFSAMGILIIAVAVRFLHRSLARRIRHPDHRYHARKLITFAGYLAGILLITIVFGDKLGHLTVAFGVAGAGVAFALQEVIASIAGWVAISLGHFYQIGDRVQLGGIMGDAIDIGVLRTTLMECGEWVNSDLYSGRIVRLANSFVFKEPVFNYSADFPFLWDEITVPVKYGSDHQLAREILQRVVHEVTGGYVARAETAWRGVVEKYRVEKENVEPMVTLIANDNWIEFTARYMVDYKQRRAVKDQIFTRILEAFEQTGDRVTIASTTIQIVEMPAFDVRLGEKTKQLSDQDS